MSDIFYITQTKVTSLDSLSILLFTASTSKSNVKSFITKTQTKEEHKHINNMAEAVKTPTVKEILDSLVSVTTPAEPTRVAELKDVLKVLKAAVINLSKVVEAETEKSVELQKELRQHADEIDNQKQRNLKGKFVITSDPKLQTPSPIKSKEVLEQERIDVKTHVAKLALDYYKVTIKEEEIEKCYLLPKGGIVLSLWNKSPGSSFQLLTDAIKKNEKTPSNLFFNFMLTKKRSKLLFEIRKLKRAGKVTKFYSDEDGVISVRLANNNNKNERVTNIRSKETSFLSTMTVEELIMKAQ